MTTPRTILTLAALATGLWACSSNTSTQQATVQFRVSSPLCGALTRFQLTFLIDSSRVGTDSLHDGDVSPSFHTTPGSHHLSAFIANDTNRLWLDTTAVLPADSVFVQTVGLYCS